MVHVNATKLKDCMRQFALSRKLRTTLDSTLVHWTVTAAADTGPQVVVTHTLQSLQPHLGDDGLE